MGERGDLSNFLQSNIPLIERYLLSDKPQDVIGDLQPNTPSYFLIRLLNLPPSSAEFMEIYDKLMADNIQWTDELFLKKIPEAIRSSEIPEE